MRFRKAILLAGDANLWGHLAHSFFARDGFHLLRAGDGATAWRMLEEHDPALAVIDLDFAGMAELCLRVKTDPVLRGTPVLLLCSEAPGGAEAACREAAEAVLRKPYEPPELLAAAGELLNIPLRRQPRLTVDLPGTCDTGEEAPGAGRVVNLSVGGVFFATDRLFPVGTRLLVRFALPGGRPLACQGRVAWVNHPEWVKKPDLPSGMGVKFLAPDASERQALTEFVDAGAEAAPFSGPRERV